MLAFGEKLRAQRVERGLYFQSENFNLSEKRAQDRPFLLEINLLPLKATGSPVADASKPLENPDRTIVLKNVFFDTDKSILKSESFVELNKLKLLLTENPKMRIELRGHTDNVGSDASNLDLSTRRAAAVKDFLIQNGITADRLQSKGFGESQPVDTNETPEGRQNNRRTEFLILD